MTEQINVATQILDVAQEIMQTKGYNAFSYADIATRVGIRKASIHYYFPNKSDLGKAVIGRYRTEFRAKVARIDKQNLEIEARLKAYVELFGVVAQKQRICLCGMLAADIQTLDPAIQTEVQGFFTENEQWLSQVLTEGVAKGLLRRVQNVETEARLFLAGLEGAMLIARSYGSANQFQVVARQLVTNFFS
jgi:TetR/AcrR family transcriptional regulator, transcriptional repressor for nem operon